MDFNNLANMKLSDFENIGKAEYNKGFAEALSIVIKLLSNQVCEDYNADSACGHGDRCSILFELSNGISGVKNSLS